MGKSNNIIIIISFIVAFFCGISPTPGGYQYLFLHPLIYGVAFAVCIPLKTSKFLRPSLFVLFATTFVRYVISPLFLVLGNFPQANVNDPYYLNMGILLMVYEEVLVFIIISKYGMKLVDQNNKERAYFEYSTLKSSPLLILLIIFGFGILFMMPEVLSRYHFVLTLKGNEYDFYNENTAFAYSLLVDLARFILVLLLISYFSGKYRQTERSRYVIYAVLVIGLNMLFVHDISRFSILIPTIVFTYLILQLFPNQRSKILGIVLMFTLLSVGFTTMIKMFSESRGGSENSNDIASWAVTIQQYFMGQRDVGVGLYVADKIPNMGFFNLFNDIISNIIGLNQFYRPQVDTLTLYNYEYNQGPWVDKIFPNLCAGYTYFGAILSPIITLIFVALSIKFDVKSYNESKIEYKFLWVYSSIMCGFIMMQWYPMIVCILTNIIFVLYVIFKINESLNKR